jgi:prepilin-type processing-associated H-X9-DG protein
MANALERPKTSGKALVSLVLGLVSPVGLIVTGAPALLIGLAGLREINQSEGRLRGRVAAVTGMLLGAAGCAVGVIGSIVLLFLHYGQLAARTTCSDHLMYIGRAVMAYRDDHDPAVFPPGTIRHESLPPEERLSWMVSLLPYVKQEKLYERFDKSKAWNDGVNGQAAASSVLGFHCPGNPNLAQPGMPALTHYVGLAGLGADAATFSVKDRRAGFFGYDRTIDLADVTRGTSYTMMVAETTANNGPWAAGGPATVRGVDSTRQPYFGPGRQFGGAHPGGLNILHADGHVAFLRDTMTPLAFENQVTIADN